MKRLYINKYKRINSELFDRVRLTSGLSITGIALDVKMSPETVRRAMTVGSDPRPATIMKLGTYLKIPPEHWYVPRESMNPVLNTVAETEEADKQNQERRE